MFLDYQEFMGRMEKFRTFLKLASLFQAVTFCNTKRKVDWENERGQLHRLLDASCPRRKEMQSGRYNNFSDFQTIHEALSKNKC